MNSLSTAISVSSFAALAACGGGGDTAAENIAAGKDKTMTRTIPVERGYAPVNGLKMYYEISGTGGTSLVLLHGGGSTIDTSFDKILPSFARTRQVIAVELQVHGHTANIDRPLTFEQDADDVGALLRHLRIEAADFFGYNNGGNTVLQIAIRHPDLMRKMVLPPRSSTTTDSTPRSESLF